jgi:hypothetical protein
MENHLAAIDIDTTPSLSLSIYGSNEAGRHLRAGRRCPSVPPLLPYLEGIDKAASR